MRANQPEAWEKMRPLVESGDLLVRWNEAREEPEFNPQNALAQAVMAMAMTHWRRAKGG